MVDFDRDVDNIFPLLPLTLLFTFIGRSKKINILRIQHRDSTESCL